jgi:hypothetical protein
MLTEAMRATVLASSPRSTLRPKIAEFPETHPQARNPGGGENPPIFVSRNSLDISDLRRASGPKK